MSLRERLSLGGTWGFCFDPSAELSIAQCGAWQPAQAPMPWQAQFPELRVASGAGWYRRSFDVPATWAGRAVALHFGAVDYPTQVWVNGEYAGAHEGGYLPFEFEIPAWLHEQDRRSCP